MNVLLIGSGGREHALAWKLAQSPRLGRLYAAPGNPGIAAHATLTGLDVADHAAVITFCRDNTIGLVVVGPEVPLVAGLVDDLAAASIAAFGPTKAAARLEGSKGFTKDLCARAGIPTAAYGRFSDRATALAYLERTGAPVVVKADGLAAGKGVVVAETMAEAIAAVEACFEGSFGDAGAEVVIEEKLTGPEVSFFALTDGKTVVPFATAQDHKRAYDDDQGPNTGGMGAYSPAPILTPDLSVQVMRTIVEPTVEAMAAAGTPFSGVLYAGLMLTPTGPQLIEYNVRFGDPECQAMMARLESDLLEVLYAVATGNLAGLPPLAFRREAALTVVMAARGYPGKVEAGSRIGSIGKAESLLPGGAVFHAGTKQTADGIVAAGGRVLNVTALGSTLRAARDAAYAAVDVIEWPEGFCRRDIGARALQD